MLSVLDERIESGREFQTVGAAARKEREPKIRLMQGTSKRLEERDVELHCVALKVRVASLNLMHH